VAVLKFQFDESYGPRAMCVGGWLANELEWKKFERMWTKRLAYFNSRIAPNQQVGRFHAAPLNCRKGSDNEFKNWTQEMGLAFSKKFLSTIQKRDMQAITMATDMAALLEAFPDGEKDEKEVRGYGLCIRQMMVEIGKTMREQHPNDQVLIVHDRGNWDAEAATAYNLMVDDVRWESRKFFVGISAMSGEDSIGLQAADLVAYETYKFVSETVMPDTDKIRGSLRAIFERRLKFNAKYLDAPTLRKLSDMVKARLSAEV
jgi:hypothetical protein